VINFRFHLVSLVAVFLALAIGVVAGGALGQPTVDTLQNRIDTVEANAEQRRAENDDLRGALDSANGAIDESSPFSVTDRLPDVPVTVVAVRGVDEDAVARTVLLARRAGATAPGIVWLEDRWALPERDDVQALSRALGLTASDRRAPLRADAWGVLAARIADGAPPNGPDPLRALQDAGFVTLAGVGSDAPAPDRIGGPSTRAVLVTGTGAAVPDRLVVEPLARVAVNRGIALVAAEVFPDDTQDASRGDSIEPIRSSDALTDRVSTVDDLERTEGSVAAVLALADLGRGVVGDYGIGDGAERQLPEWWQT
jgi:Copper transport outer membrane protein, MctB